MKFIALSPTSDKPEVQDAGLPIDNGQWLIPARVMPRPGCDRINAILWRLTQIHDSGDNPLAVIGVTSCHHGAGVSTISANLAIRAAELGLGRVLLLDANVERPSVAKIFRIRQPGPGLGDLLLGQTELRDCVRNSGVTNLKLLHAGVQSRERVVFCPEFYECLLRELRLEFNIIVVDLPHVLGHPHAAILASLMVGVLLVVEGERDRRPWMAASKKQLEDAGANLIGAVLNKRRQYLPSFISRWF